MMDTNARILYMEDDPGYARLLQKRLGAIGYQVDIARDGLEGLAMYETTPYDVVVVDQVMPGCDGLEVINRLSSSERLPPIIMITGGGDERTAVQALKLGARDYLVKDISGGYLELLPSVIEQVLYQQRLIWEKQQAEEALRRSEERYRLLAENSLDLIALLDTEGCVVYASPSHRQVLGYAPEELIHRDLTTLLNADDLAVAQAAFQMLLATSESQTIELRLRRRNGEVQIVEAILSRICGGEQLADRILFSARNITERKQAEEALRQQTIELQARNEDLNAFAHTVAHDLKDPLVYIVGLAEILKESHHATTSEKRQELSATIAEQGYRMSNIIDELLLLASIRKQNIEPKPINMARIIDEVRQRLIYMINHSETELRLPSVWPEASGYGPWIEEVWTNYISNAIKYGGQPPCVELGSTIMPNGKIRFWVRDNGQGLEPEEQARLFSPFTQLERVRATGHGLGLSIVRRIIEKLGGEVGVESQTGCGSTFWFALPAAETNSPMRPTITTTAISPGPT